MDKLKDEYISKLKRVYLAEHGVDLSDLERYEKYITANDNEDEIERQAIELVEDIKAQSPNYADVSIDRKPYNPF